MQVLNIVVRGPGKLSLNYILFDPSEGSLINKGDGQPVTNSGFTITLPAELTSTLKPGRYQLLLTASSDAISTVAEGIKLIEASATPPTTSVPTTTPGQVPVSGLDPTVFVGAAGAVGAVLVAFLLLRMTRKMSEAAWQPNKPLTGYVDTPFV